MASSSTGFTSRDMFKEALLRLGFSGGRVGSSTVSKYYMRMFNGFKVKDWSDFFRCAAQMYVGEKTTVNVEKELFDETKAAWNAREDSPKSEKLLLHYQLNKLMKPCNKIVPNPFRKWTIEPPPIKGRHGNSLPDFCCAAGDKLIVPGEMKRPHLKLGTSLQAEDLQQKLALPFSDLEQDGYIRPFVQCFSHMAHSENGVGILSNYNETRYFRISFKEKCIYMSPVVLVDQVWDENEIPHPIQAMLFAESFKSPENEFNGEMAELVVERSRGSCKTAIKEYKTSYEGGRGGEKKGEPPHGYPGVEPANDVTVVAQGLGGPLSDVSLVSADCKHLRVLGEGESGIVWECLYEGRLVALKMGLPFNPWVDENDQFKAVNNEIETYNKLLPLQGKYIPRVVAGGYEPWFTPGGMALITEKVGHALVRDEDDAGVFYLDGKKLSEEEIEQLKESGVEGLRAIHMFDVAHVDNSITNFRVEREGGRLRVWWIDFGFAERRHSGESKEHEVETFLSMFNGEHRGIVD